MPDFPRIKSRRTTKVSPWVDIIEREVEFAPGREIELYHSVGQQDYIAIVGLTADGKIPLVHQYRPALERFTWELPAGLVDKGETAIDTCRRELLEETGHPALAVHELGVLAPCTARLSNRVHSFFAEMGSPAENHTAESGIELKLATPAEVAAMILAGAFDLQLHVGALMLAGMRGFIDLGAFKP